MNDMNNNKKAPDRRVRKTKKALRESLVTLMAQMNTRDISVQELSDLADINRATFYLHYKDIYELQQEVEDDVVREINTLFDKHMPVEDTLKPYPFFVALLGYMKENATLCEMLLSDNSNRSFLHKLCALVEERCLHIWLAQHQFKNAEEVSYFSSYLVYGFVAVITKWTLDGMRTPPNKLAGMMERMGLCGIGFLEHLGHDQTKSE